MSMVPRWMARFPRPKGRDSDLFSLGKFFEDLEDDLMPMASYSSGLSVSSDDIEAHVPGLTAKEVEVSIDNSNLLWIKGEKLEEEKDKKKKFYRRSQSAFSYCSLFGKSSTPVLSLKRFAKMAS